MSDSDKRTVVEGVEFAQLFHFPRILRALTAGFQPPRLVLGLLMVAALMTGGRVWDGVFSPTVAPGGLRAGQWTTEHADIADEILQAAMESYISEGGPEGDPDPRKVLAGMQAGYKDQRKTLVDAAGDDAGREALRQADESYLRTVEQIELMRPKGIFEATLNHVTTSFNLMASGLVSLRLDDFFNGLADLFVGTPIGMWQHDSFFTVVYGLFFVVVIAIGGGALSRMAVVETAHDEKLRLQESLDFALSSWRRLIFALLLPLVIAAVLCIILLVGGWFLMLPWVDVLGGLLYGVALLLGFGVVFLMIGYAAGFSLLIPAVASENCDAADAQQRAYAYVLSRPLHLLGYGAVGVFGLALGFVVASLIAAAVLNVTGALIDTVTTNAAMSGAHGFALFDLEPRREVALPLQLHSEWSARLVLFWQTVVVCLVAAYVFANYFGASTIIYLLMRRACDGQETTEIWEGGVATADALNEPEAPDEPIDNDHRDAEEQGQ